MVVSLWRGEGEDGVHCNISEANIPRRRCELCVGPTALSEQGFVNFKCLVSIKRPCAAVLQFEHANGDVFA